MRTSPRPRRRNTLGTSASSDFTFPTDDFYALGVTLSGTGAADSFVGLAAQLQIRYT